MTRAIEEERAKQPAGGAAPVSEPEIPNRSESSSHRDAGDSDSKRVKELEFQNRDLEIATRVKDQMLALLQQERGEFHKQLIGMSRYVGELETQLLALGGAPAATTAFHALRKDSEPRRTMRSRCEIREVFHGEGLHYDARRYTLEQ